MAAGRSTSDYSGEPMTEQENRELRRILEADRSLRWVTSAVKNFALWFTTIAAAVVLYFQFFGKGTVE